LYWKVLPDPSSKPTYNGKYYYHCYFYYYYYYYYYHYYHYYYYYCCCCSNIKPLGNYLKLNVNERSKLWGGTTPLEVSLKLKCKMRKWIESRN
jgi:hypothetical protein